MVVKDRPKTPLPIKKPVAVKPPPPPPPKKTPRKTPAKKTATKTRNYQAGLDRKHEIEMEKIRQRGETNRMALKYVMEDFRSQLLVVALTSSGVGVALAAYEDYLAQKLVDDLALPEGEEPAPTVSFWFWMLHLPEIVGVGAGLAATTMFYAGDIPALEVMQNADNPYKVIAGMTAGAKDVAGLAWAALFASILMGEGGIGGVISAVSDVIT